jgi:hypothetical protein
MISLAPYDVLVSIIEPAAWTVGIKEMSIFYISEKLEGRSEEEGVGSIKEEPVVPKIRSDISQIVSKIAVGFAYSPYGRPTRSIRVGNTNKSTRRKSIPIIAWRIWFTAFLIFSSSPPDIIIKNPHHII